VGPVFADPTQLQQVVMNLCTNAFHAMQSHGGTLTVALRAVPGGIAPSPDDDTDRRSEALMLSISDTGSGMSQETLDRVFEPYFTTKRPGEGTGMGLAVVHGIVTGHGGTIDVHSKPGIGTQIDILLPRTQKMVDEQHFGAREAKGGREKVIVVDDEEQIVRMQEQMLNQLGYRVTAFTDSISALERFDDSPYSFDVVLTDLTMPKLTGDRLAREMLKIRPDIPIILCTGFSELIDEKTAHEMGIRKLLFKPVVKAELADALRDALDTDRA
jgi:CheY-like chemotaxis protein